MRPLPTGILDHCADVAGQKILLRDRFLKPPVKPRSFLGEFWHGRPKRLRRLVQDKQEGVAWS